MRADGTFVPVPTIDAPLFEDAFRRRVINCLLRHGKITPAMVEAVHSWHHLGFPAHTPVRITPEKPHSAERVVCCLLRPPLPAARTHGRHATRVEILRTRPAADGTPVLTLDPLKFLARATSHIPPPRRDQLRYYGAYAPVPAPGA